MYMNGINAMNAIFIYILLCIVHYVYSNFSSIGALEMQMLVYLGQNRGRARDLGFPR